MKKFLALFAIFALVLAITFAFVSCGDDDNLADTDSVETSETVASDDSGETTDSDSDTSPSDTSDTKPADTDNKNDGGVPGDTSNDMSWTKNY